MRDRFIAGPGAVPEFSASLGTAADIITTACIGTSFHVNRNVEGSVSTSMSVKVGTGVNNSSGVVAEFDASLRAAANTSTKKIWVRVQMRTRMSERV